MHEEGWCCPTTWARGMLCAVFYGCLRPWLISGAELMKVATFRSVQAALGFDVCANLGVSIRAYVTIWRMDVESGDMGR